MIEILTNFLDKYWIAVAVLLSWMGTWIFVESFISLRMLYGGEDGNNRKDN